MKIRSKLLLLPVLSSLIFPISPSTHVGAADSKLQADIRELGAQKEALSNDSAGLESMAESYLQVSLANPSDSSGRFESGLA